MTDRYTEAIAASKVTEDDAAVKAAVAKILEKTAEYNTPEVWKFLFSSIDLTTLSTEDSPRSVARFTQRVNDFEEQYPQYPHVAAICTYPNFAEVVSTNLDVTGVEVAVVAAAFPSAQSMLPVKISEAALAVADGATEVDIVNNVGLFLDGDYEDMCDEIIEIKHAIRGAHLKVILETGALRTAANIKKASVLALFSEADFLKTSTGKIYSGASLEAAYVMCSCIKEYYEATGRRVGFKAAGGVRSTDEAVAYYTLVREVLGEEWLTHDLFRIGASSLANHLLSSMEGKEVKFF